MRRLLGGMAVHRKGNSKYVSASETERRVNELRASLGRMSQKAPVWHLRGYRVAERSRGMRRHASASDGEEVCLS